ncbi:HAD family hydrolase [Maridesulfovibrio sp.]|uniref:HAD family hydrolase n=1 Tax=Maridesulfovibrio sp. TaxID=2795000 RepID=UPI0029F53BA0|nr:HAD family hydrolase [Maridesulfovibrio sp.]
MFYGTIKAVAFDADDTLWVNETYFGEAKSAAARLFSSYVPEDKFLETLELTQTCNIPAFGYGVKSFVLSMIEAANKIVPGKIKSSELDSLIALGRDMLTKPVELIAGVKDVLHVLEPDYRLFMITKGDFAEQKRKIVLSGMSDFFEHIEILPEKDEAAYERILSEHDINPNEFLMVGNSVKSDVLPVVCIGASAAHIPFHTTWVHEVVCEDDMRGRDYVELNNISELLPLLTRP